MKFTLAAVVAMAAMVTAQGDIPSCAKPCLDDAVKSETQCSTTDYACICKGDTFSKVQGAATGCVLKECGQDVALNKVLPAAQALCKNPPTESSAAAPTSAAATSAAATSAVASESAKPTQTMAPTQPNNGTQPTGVVVAGAAGVAPAGALAILAVAAMAL